MRPSNAWKKPIRIMMMPAKNTQPCIVDGRGRESTEPVGSGCPPPEGSLAGDDERGAVTSLRPFVHVTGDRSRLGGVHCAGGGSILGNRRIRISPGDRARLL